MCPCSMDGFRVVKLSEVIRQMDVVITCTGAVYTIQLHLVQIFKRKYVIVTIWSSHLHLFCFLNRQQKCCHQRAA